MTEAPRKHKILAVASGGGHWGQLLRLKPLFNDCATTFVTVNRAYRSEVRNDRFYVINDATRWNKIGLLVVFAQLALILLKERPDVIISTGAAPGYIALRLGRIFGAKTIWIDSIANVEQLSLSGQWARATADLWLTQWPHLAKPNGPHFVGTLL